MGLTKAALLTAAALTFVAAPANAQSMVDGGAMTVLPDGSSRSMHMTKLPKGAKLMKAPVAFVMMNGKMYMVTGRDAAIMQSSQ